MPVIEVPADLSVDHLLKAVKQLSPADLDRFGREFRDWEASESCNGEEGALLARIQANSKLPGTQQKRFEELRQKRQDETLTPQELRELQSLWDRVEEMNVVRIEALILLAERRGSSLRTLMRDLGIPEQPDAF